MADAKISALTSLTGANVDPAADVFPIVDTSVTTTKKITAQEVFNAASTLTALTGANVTTADDSIPIYDLSATAEKKITVDNLSIALATGAVGLGVWTTPAFNAGDFTASGSMTWTVAAGDVTTYEYTIIGKMMFLNFAIEATTVGGTPSIQLKIAIPASKVSTKTSLVSVVVFDNSDTVNEAGYCSVSPSGTVVNIRRNSGVNWSASTDHTWVYGHLAFEIN